LAIFELFTAKARLTPPPLPTPTLRSSPLYLSSISSKNGAICFSAPALIYRSRRGAVIGGLLGAVWADSNTAQRGVGVGAIGGGAKGVIRGTGEPGQ
tara:strand:- start:2683 stop:2973 length:291 start_codon:yes stop_codon:yes gene_type:complete